MELFTKIQPVSLSASVTQSIVDLIAQGKIKPGERLPTEHELMELFGVGRSSIREAVRGLAVMGILEAKPHRGTFVVSPVPNMLGEKLRTSIEVWALKDLYEVRMLLEEYAAGVAATVATSQDIREIEKHALAVKKKVAAGQPYFSENFDFHLSIAKAAHNAVLVYCLRSIIGTFRELREEISYIQRDMHAQDVKEHDDVLAAIKARQADGARRLIRRHLSYFISKLDELGSKQASVGRPRRARR